MARKQPSSTPRPPMGAIGFVLAGMVLFGMGFFWKDALGVRYSFGGGLIWVGAFGLAFVSGVLYYAQFLIPMSGNTGWLEAMWLVLYHYLKMIDKWTQASSRPAPQTRGKRVVQVEPEPEKLPPPSGLAQLPPTFAELEAGILQSYQAISISRNNRFNRAAGPGFVLLYREEVITALLDLRKHVRREPVKAHSRDGISVETTLSVTFRIKRTAVPGQHDNVVHPYDKEMIFHLTHIQRIDADNQVHDWREQIMMQAVTLFINELAKYDLNQLYIVDDAGTVTLDGIKQSIRLKLQEQFEPFGLEILGVGTSIFGLPTAVIEQRIEMWQSKWKQQIQRKQAEGKAETVRRHNRARARAEIKMIETIAHNIEAMRHAEHANLSEIITLRMIEILEKAASDKSMQAFLPQQMMSSLVMEASSQMKHWMGQAEGEG